MRVKSCQMAIDLSSITDDELARLCRHGEGRAFRELYERYRQPVINFAYRMLGDRDGAGDILQETFQYFFRKLPGYRAEGRLRNLLFRVARNLCLNRLKKFRGLRTVPLDEALAVSGTTGESIIASLETKELQEKAAEALKKIPEIYSEVIVLRILNGMSYRDIAAVVDCPEGTVKSRLHNGLELLRKELGRQGIK